MNKLHTLPLVLLAWNLSCSSNAQTTAKPAPAKPAASLASELIGSWMMSSTSYVTVHRVSKTETTKETVESQCNVCPKITFNADGTGFIKTGTGDVSANHFTWKVLGNNLSFTNNTVKTGSVLANGIYKIVHPEGVSHGSELALVDSKNTEQTLSKLN